MKTLNKAVARYNGISLIVRILIGLIIGAVLALVAPGAGLSLIHISTTIPKLLPLFWLLSAARRT